MTEEKKSFYTSFGRSLAITTGLVIGTFIIKERNFERGYQQAIHDLRCEESRINDNMRYLRTADDIQKWSDYENHFTIARDYLEKKYAGESNEKTSKKYARPQRLYDKVRIEEENGLRKKYGLKNKKEIWKADAAISRIRSRAKKLITALESEKKHFIEKLHKKGFNVLTLSDALGLNKEDWLKRRLQSILIKKQLVTTPKQARQFITHKHVKIGDSVVNIPSYQVTLAEEPLVHLMITLKVERKKSKEEIIKDEIFNESSNIVNDNNTEIILEREE